MTETLPKLRYERKFVGDGLHPGEVLALVQRHPALFRQAYPPRFVNNIYLDSFERADFHDHVSGTANRSKTRVRWYDTAPGQSAKPFLERKIKRGQVSGKQTYPLHGLLLNGGPAHPALRTAFETSGLPEWLRADLLRLEPVLHNRYRRHYFLSGDGQFRLTVDSDLQFGGGAMGNGSSTLGPPLPRKVILELKCEPVAAEHADQIANLLPFRLARCSKYILGMDALRMG